MTDFAYEEAIADLEATRTALVRAQLERDTFAQRNATQALTIHMKREAWFAEKTRADAVEAARDHLRARLEQVVKDLYARAEAYDSPSSELLTPGYAFREAARSLADLLAILTERPHDV